MEIIKNQHQWTLASGGRKPEEHPEVNLDNRNILKINCKHEHSNQFCHQYDKVALLN